MSSHRQATAGLRASVSMKTLLQKHWGQENTSPHPMSSLRGGGKRAHGSAMGRRTSAEPVRATLALSKGSNSPALGLFSSSSEMVEERWLLRGQCLETSCLPSQGETTHQLFSAR